MNTDPTLTKLQIGQEIALFSKNILLLLLYQKSGYNVPFNMRTKLASSLYEFTANQNLFWRDWEWIQLEFHTEKKMDIIWQGMKLCAGK